MCGKLKLLIYNDIYISRTYILLCPLLSLPPSYTRTPALPRHINKIETKWNQQAFSKYYSLFLLQKLQVAVYTMCTCYTSVFISYFRSCASWVCLCVGGYWCDVLELSFHLCFWRYTHNAENRHTSAGINGCLVSTEQKKESKWRIGEVESERSKLLFTSMLSYFNSRFYIDILLDGLPHALYLGSLPLSCCSHYFIRIKIHKLNFSLSSPFKRSFLTFTFSNVWKQFDFFMFAFVWLSMFVLYICIDYSRACFFPHSKHDANAFDLRY